MGDKIELFGVHVCVSKCILTINLIIMIRDLSMRNIVHIVSTPQTRDMIMNYLIMKKIRKIGHFLVFYLGTHPYIDNKINFKSVCALILIQ
jgi:hypothetical protein